MKDSLPENEALSFTHHCYTDAEVEAERQAIEAWKKHVLGVRVDLLPEYFWLCVAPESVIPGIIALGLSANVVPSAGPLTWLAFGAAVFGAIAAGKITKNGWIKHTRAQARAIYMLAPLRFRDPDDLYLGKVVQLTKESSTLKTFVATAVRDGKKLRRRDLIAMQQFRLKEEKREQALKREKQLEELIEGILAPQKEAKP